MWSNTLGGWSSVLDKKLPSGVPIILPLTSYWKLMQWVVKVPSATSTHIILTSNSMVKDIEEWRTTNFLRVF